MKASTSTTAGDTPRSQGIRHRWPSALGLAAAALQLARGPDTETVATVIGVALALVVAGLLLRVSRSPLTAQTAALIGYGGVAVAALFLAPGVGLVLAGVALVGHSVWDVIHYRRNQVVHRSLAEFCVLLDVPLGVDAIVLAIAG